jgi:hypothetical protein
MENEWENFVKDIAKRIIHGAAACVETANCMCALRTHPACLTCLTHIVLLKAAGEL